MARTKISFGHKQLAGGVVRAEDAKQDDRVRAPVAAKHAFFGQKIA